MSTNSLLSEVDISKKYADYLQSSKEIQKGSWKSLLIYLVVSLLLFSSFFWAGIRVAPWLMLLGMGVLVIGELFVNKRAGDRASTVGISKPGFKGFFKLHRNYYWTKQLPSGKKLERFLSLIGEKSPPERIPKYLFFPWIYLSIAIVLAIGVIVISVNLLTTAGYWWVELSGTIHTYQGNWILSATIPFQVEDDKTLSGLLGDIQVAAVDPKWQLRYTPFDDPNCVNQIVISAPIEVEGKYESLRNTFYFGFLNAPAEPETWKLKITETCNGIPSPTVFASTLDDFGTTGKAWGGTLLVWLMASLSKFSEDTYKLNVQHRISARDGEKIDNFLCVIDQPCENALTLTLHKGLQAAKEQP